MSIDSVSDTSDVDFDLMEQITKKYFSEIEHSVPHLQQTLFDFQNECYKTWKNTINSNLSLQKEFLTKVGFNSSFPKPTQQIIDNMDEEILKYRSMCNKITIAAIEYGTKNIKTWNENANMLVDLNKKMMQFWTSAFMTKYVLKL